MPPRKQFKLSLQGRSLLLGQRTAIMGIVNLTPDSFSGDGCLARGRRKDVALRLACRMVRQGADILDVGGESTRPGARPVGWKEENQRILPAVKAIVARDLAPVSVDTWKPEVAHAALDAGASIINVVQGCRVSPAIIRLVRRYDAAIVLMHMRGIPATMQSLTHYYDLLAEIVAELKKSVEKCLETGIKKEKIIVDPGICFSKTAEQNFLIIADLAKFAALGHPVLVGPSRKSFIGKTLDLDVTKRLNGTAAAVTSCILNGAHMVRVHDIPQMREVAGIADAVLGAVNPQRCS